MSFIEEAQGKASAFKSLFDFIVARKKWWLAPLLIILFLLGILIVLTESTALAPLIYTLF